MLKTHLVYCHANFSFLLQPTSELEKTINLSKITKGISDILDILNEINSLKDDVVLQNLQSCFCKNRGVKSSTSKTACLLEREDIIVDSEGLLDECL